ncbi:17846_t:CDS:2 [Racocetra fulgida]|uniref:17846_t:CDS:1 n=1 Tax=Racocetra fulgida TaxID=60492 RepID=A0A9N9H0G1_9GLOM|nr:17846_t:CDS:2 [Racocetra fulgida]
MNTKPEPLSITANYLKKNVEKLLPEAFANWLEYMRKEEKRVGILFPAMVKFAFSPHMSEYVDYG